MYFNTPNFSVAFNAKVASSSLARSIIKTFYPDIEERIATYVHFPEGKSEATAQFQWMVPRDLEASKPVVLVLREPVDRFRTAMAQLSLSDVDAALTALEENGTVTGSRGRQRHLRSDEHFLKQSDKAAGETHLFKLADVDAAATLIGLPLPLPVINEASREKPVLTPEQEARVLAYYAEDVSMFESVVAPGTKVTIPAPSYLDDLTIEQLKAEVDATLAGEALDLQFTGVTVEGILPAPVTLGATKGDQAAFSGILTLLREAAELLTSTQRTAFLAQPQTITDINGATVTVPDVKTLRQVLVAYGNQIQQRWTAVAEARSSVAASSDVSAIRDRARRP